jgi:hypothetical protein
MEVHDIEQEVEVVATQNEFAATTPIASITCSRGHTFSDEL